MQKSKMKQKRAIRARACLWIDFCFLLEISSVLRFVREISYTKGEYNTYATRIACIHVQNTRHSYQGNAFMSDHTEHSWIDFVSPFYVYVLTWHQKLISIAELNVEYASKKIACNMIGLGAKFLVWRYNCTLEFEFDFILLFFHRGKSSTYM